MTSEANADQARGDQDGKIAAKAGELRKQGATFAIIAHTLDIPYSRAVALGKAYDTSHGNHEPQRLVRRASEVTLPGYVVKDGRGNGPAKSSQLKQLKRKLAKGKAARPRKVKGTQAAKGKSQRT